MRFVKKNGELKINMSNTSNFKTSIIFSVVAIMLLIAPANAEIDIILDKLSPQPVEPGQDLIMAITLSNQNADVNGVKLSIFPDSPIILKNDNDRVINEDNIIKYGAIVETYLLHIDPRAVSGVYEIEFEAQWMNNGQPREINKIFKIIVQGVPQLAVSNITIRPELISPKDTFNLTFSVSNEGTGIAREVQINAATIGLPFVPVGSDTKIIKNLGPNESIQLNYNLLVKDKTLISSYSIPIKMDYKDENGKNLSSQSFVGVKVLGNAELSIENIKTDPQNPAKGDAVIITMRIENSGNGDARSVKVGLNIPFEGTRTAFLGKIKPDDDAPGIFSFYATESGDIPYNASIEFEDDLGKHTINEALTLNVRNTNENGIIIPVIVVVLLGGAFVFYFLHSRKSRQ